MDRDDKERLAEALREKRRRRCKQDFLAFCEDSLPNGQAPAAHHRLLIAELQALAEGKCDRLMVLMPPGSAKTTYASVLFAPWFMAQRVGLDVIGAAYGSDYAEGISENVLRVVKEQAQTLGYNLLNESRQFWRTSTRGQYRAAGAGGGITGRRADLFVIDDPIKGREDADSDIIREKIWGWYRAEVITRLKPNSKMILIQTRWHSDDLAGRLLEQMKEGGDQWRVLSLPALALADDPLGRPEGAPLWPEWEDEATLKRKRAVLGEREWSALFQQQPSPETGTYFNRDWLRPSLSVPRRQDMRIYGASDYAVTADGGDYTVHVVVGVDIDNRLWLLDVWRDRTTSDIWVDALCDLVSMWSPVGWAEESGQIKGGVGPFLVKRMRERRTYVARQSFPTRGDKSVRAQSIRGRMALDGLHFLATAPWRTDLETELMQFPAGKHDDQCDALGLVGQLIDQMVAPRTLGGERRDRAPSNRLNARGSAMAA